MNTNTLKTMLESVLEHPDDFIQHTGDTWSKRVIRPFWELFRTLQSMFVEAPLVSMLIIGLPASMLSIICYCICCLPNENYVEEARLETTIPEFSDNDDSTDSEVPEKSSTDKKDE